MGEQPWRWTGSRGVRECDGTASQRVQWMVGISGTARNAEASAAASSSAVRMAMHSGQSASIRSVISIRQTVFSPQREHVSVQPMGETIS
jgi:hypothetical protein